MEGGVGPVQAGGVVAGMTLLRVNGEDALLRVADVQQLIKQQKELHHMLRLVFGHLPGPDPIPVFGDAPAAVASPEAAAARGAVAVVPPTAAAATVVREEHQRAWPPGRLAASFC